MPKQITITENKLGIAADIIEKHLQSLPQVDCKVEHAFKKNMYIRTTHVPKGTVLFSEIHKTRHRFKLRQGRLIILNITTHELVEMVAPFEGITLPMTRRLVKAEEDSIFVTYHQTKLKDVEQIGNEILVQRDGFFSQYKVEASKKVSIIKGQEVIK
jgi:hypothetical protein